MFNIKTNVPEIDKENVQLIKASEILEQIGNEPNPTATQFYAQLVVSDYPREEHEEITMAAISIEAMMNLELIDPILDEPTVH
tara:strand:+ start:350 stop:598 length:249 start_codon:yes stop_codon:yes gene_type:complete